MLNLILDRAALLKLGESTDVVAGFVGREDSVSFDLAVMTVNDSLNLPEHQFFQVAEGGEGVSVALQTTGVDHPGMRLMALVYLAQHGTARELAEGMAAFASR
ncbi:hypothetical protein ACFSR9_09190 [Deinococcus taklimakanensis]|uniref:Uncharacterized protein n=1 Tax=Deinococcus taklimakanensis TaxID=536443 RepID=A0ABW5P3B9_9DEIO